MAQLHGIRMHVGRWRRTLVSSVTVPGLWVAFSQARISGWFITSLVLVLILAIVSAPSQGSVKCACTTLITSQASHASS